MQEQSVIQKQTTTYFLANTIARWKQLYRFKKEHFYGVEAHSDDFSALSSTTKENIYAGFLFRKFEFHKL